jgi:hypothetical protein
VTKVSDFSTKNRAFKLQPTWQLTDVLSKLKLLNAFTALTLPAVFPSCVVDRQGIHLHEPVQGLNLNRRSISGLEPEMLVTVWKWKMSCPWWKANPNTPFVPNSSLITSLSYPAVNPSMPLGFKFQILPRTERSSIYTSLMCIHDRSVYRDRQHILN